MERLKVFINGKETNLNALDYLKYCLAIKNIGNHILQVNFDFIQSAISVELKESGNNE